MKTVFIYDQCGDANIQFKVFESTKSIQQFNHCYQNCEMPSGVKKVDFDSFMQQLEECEPLEIFPVEEVRNGAEVVVVGFPP